MSAADLARDLLQALDEAAMHQHILERLRETDPDRMREVEAAYVETEHLDEQARIEEFMRVPVMRWFHREYLWAMSEWFDRRDDRRPAADGAAETPQTPPHRRGSRPREPTREEATP